ncbi:hypothetical protein LP416_21115 [Polaromonas sp. P2-4]|nr:hypothetical protein LP416_21115 [Polaromonas sp. P2-4]
MILYTGAGIATGYLTEGDKSAALMGLGIAAIFGYSFGFDYAIVSAIEFGVGLALAAVFRGNKNSK